MVSDGVNESGVAEQAAIARPIRAQSAAIARALVSIGCGERVRMVALDGQGQPAPFGVIDQMVAPGGAAGQGRMSDTYAADLIAIGA